jgi:hypothetical protein
MHVPCYSSAYFVYVKRGHDFSDIEGFGLVIGSIELLQLVTTSKVCAVAVLHTLQSL